MEAYGERQVGMKLEEIRNDHRQRYLWAISEMDGGLSVLDAGCGVGYGSYMLRDVATQVLGIDISTEAVEYAKLHWKRPGIDFESQDLHFLTFSDERVFDAVIAFECIEHLAIPELFLLRIRPYLSADACLFFSTPHETVHPLQLYRNPYHIQHYTPQSIEALLERCGYKLLELRSQNDDEIRSDMEGRYLLAKCGIVDISPGLDANDLERELPKKLQQQLVLLGNEIAQLGPLRGERNRLQLRVTELEKSKSDVTYIADALLKAENLRLIKENQALQELTTSISEKVEESASELNELLSHPAIRGVMQLNVIGLKLLGLFGLRFGR